MPSYPTAAGTGNPRIRRHVPQPFHPAAFRHLSPFDSVLHDLSNFRHRVVVVVLVVVIVVVVAVVVPSPATQSLFFSPSLQCHSRTAFLFHRVAHPARSAMQYSNHREHAHIRDPEKGAHLPRGNPIYPAEKCVLFPREFAATRAERRIRMQMSYFSRDYDSERVYWQLHSGRLDANPIEVVRATLRTTYAHVALRFRH